MEVKIIYGTDTGNTEVITEDLVKLLDSPKVETVDEINENTWNGNTLYILGIPTWYDGELQSDWEDYFKEFKTIDFTDKTVALFGLGDQIGYDEWFCDGIGILAKVIEENGGKVIGFTEKNDSFEFETSKALKNEDIFWGLCLDEDNQPELTEDRLEKWYEQLKIEINV